MIILSYIHFIHAYFKKKKKVWIWGYLHCNNTLEHIPERVAPRDIHSAFSIITFQSFPENNTSPKTEK